MLCFLCGRVGLGPEPENGNSYFDSLPIHRAPNHINCQQLFTLMIMYLSLHPIINQLYFINTVTCIVGYSMTVVYCKNNMV